MVAGVQKIYPTGTGDLFAALKDINLEVEEGEFLCLLGQSGCGKTTLLNIMAGFEKPTSGEIFIDNEPVKNPSPRRVILFQDYGLFPWRNLLANVEFGLEIQKVHTALRRAKSLELLALVGLEKFAYNYPHELSGGMQQRAALARALAVDPQILFMDEPFGALDAMTRLRLQDELASLWLKTRKTIIFVTHDISEAVYLADRIVIMSPSPGRIAKIIPVTLGRPRQRGGNDFVKIQKTILIEFELTTRDVLEYYI